MYSIFFITGYNNFLRWKTLSISTKLREISDVRPFLELNRRRFSGPFRWPSALSSEHQRATQCKQVLTISNMLLIYFNRWWICWWLHWFSLCSWWLWSQRLQRSLFFLIQINVLYLLELLQHFFSLFIFTLNFDVCAL